MSEEQIAKKSWYGRHYKLLLILPAIMMLFSIFYLYQFNSKNGDLVYKDISLTGGTTITVFDAGIKGSELKTALISEFPDLQIRAISDIRTGSQLAVFVETASETDKIKTALEKYLGYELNADNSSVEFTGSTLSKGFYQQLRFAILIAFFMMALVVFLIFRTPIPSLAVILSAFADILFTVVLINLFSIPLSIGGIVALLMLIGYSVDTDILLTTRVIRKKEGNLNDRLVGAFKTGMTMTLTSIAAVVISLAIIYSFSVVLKQIFTILFIGLIFDIFNTWITNASILKWYAEVKRIQ